MMKIVLDGERPLSWNKLYAGKHWDFRREEAERVHALVATSTYRYQAPFRDRVDIHLTAYFDNRPTDPDNICAKMYIDGLVGMGLLTNDTRKYIRRVTVQSEIDRDNPRLEIEIVELREDGIIG